MTPSPKSITHIWNCGDKRLSWSRLTGFLVLSALALLGARHAQAASLYWDLNGTTANAATAVSGTWNGTNVFWNTNSTGTGGTPQAGTTAADDLIFSSGAVYTAGTITLSGARVASSITFEDNIDVTLSGGTSLTIGGTGGTGFDGVRVLSGNNSANAISTALILATGANTIQNAGTGVLTISGGITGTQNLILQNNSTNAAGITISTTSLNNTGSLTNSGTGSGGVTVSSVIGTNVTGVTQNSATSTLTLSGPNTFTGAVTITAGALRAANNTALGTTAGGVSVASGAALELDGSAGNLVIGAEALNTLNGTGISNGGALRNIAGNNSWAGAITLADVTAVHRINSDSGTLTIGAGGITETGNNNKTLTFGGAGDVTVTGNITASAGDMVLTKDGAGTLTLSGANTYDGLTTISAGTLAYGASNVISTGGVTVNGATAVLDLGASQTDSVGTVTLAGGGSITGTGTSALTSTGTFEMQSGSVSAILAGGGIALNKTTAGTVTLSGANTYTGLTTVSAGTLAYGASNVISTGGVTVNGATAVLDLGINQSDTVGTVTVAGGGSITGTGTSTLTSTGTFAMQSGSVSAILAGAGIALNKTTAGTVTLSGVNTYTGVTTISAGVLSVGTIGNGGVAGNLGQAAVAAGNLVLSGGTLQYTGATDSTNRNFTLTNATTSTIDVVNAATNLTISGASTATTGALDKIGSGTLTLSGANLYTGQTDVQAGTLAYGANNALASGPVVVSGGTLDIKTFSDTVGAVTLSSGSITGTTGVLTGTSYSLTNTGSVSAILAGAVALTKTGAGTVTLSGVNTYTGVTTINAGTLSVGTIGNGGVAGNLGQAAVAAGNLVLGGGTLQYTGATGSTNRNFTLTGGTTSTIDIVSAGTNLTISGASTATTGALDKIGSGTLTLSGANLYTGQTDVQAGTLAYGANNALASGPVVVSGGTLDIKTFSDTVGAVTMSSGSITGTTGVLTGTSYSLTNTGSVSAILAGGVTLTKTGSGTATLSGANTYTGAVTISNGVLRVASNTALGTTAGGVSVASGAALELDGSAGNLVIGAEALNTLNGTGISNGGALRNLSGDNSWAGAITLADVTGVHRINSDSGTLTIGAGGITETGSNNNKDLTFGGAGNITVNGNITASSGDMRLFKDGSGTLTLGGANTYDGATTISGGIVKVQNNTSLGTTGTGTTVASGASIQIDGNGLTVAEGITSLDGDGAGFGALRNLANSNTWSGGITVSDTGTRINSDAGTLTLSGVINETGNSLKTLTLGGRGDLAVASITANAGDLALTKDGSGTLTLSGANTYDGVTTVKSGTMILNGANGAIASSTGITINSGATLQLDNATINLDRIGTVTVTMNGGTFKFSNPATAGADYAETAGGLSLSSGSSTISTDVSNTGSSSSSVLTFSSLSRTAGATVNFGGGTGNPSATNDDNNVRFTAQAAGLIGPWATVGGSDWATYNTASATDSVEALTTYTDVTRLSSGTKVIANGSTNNVRIIEGTGSAANITLGAATTTINTLNQSTSGGTSAATIDPAGQTLRVAGIMVGTGAGSLTIGTGTNNGTLSAATSGGELVVQNFSTNNLTINSVIANNTTASSLTTGGSGTTILTASNTYTGTTMVAGGTLQIGNAGTTGSLSTSSALVTNATLAFNRTNTVTQGTDFNSVISGTGGVTQFGSGTLVLNGTNTYTGVTTFEAGIVNVASLSNYSVAGPLGNRSAAEETVTGVGLYFSGGTLQYTGSTAQSTDRSIRVDITANGGATIDASGSVPTATMNFTSSIPNVDPWANPGSRTITLTGSNTGDNTFAINIQEYNDGTSHTNLVKSGAGTWDLTNTHNSDAQTNSYNTFGGYGGGTTISGGTLGFANNAIGGGVVDITGNATLRWDTGNTQDITTGTGAGVARSVKIEDGVTATFNTNGNNVTLSNALAVGASATGALTKTGAGSLTLGATNIYKGTTTVSGGTLDIGTGGALTATTNIMINTGGTLLLSGTGANKINNSAAVTLNGGTFALGGSTALDEQVGALTLSASSTIDFGTFAGGSTLRFADSTGAAWGAFTLSIWNWTEGADHLYFGSVFGAGLPVGGLAKILFYSDSGTTPTGGDPAAFGPDNGEVSPSVVPEPSAVFVGLGLLTLAGYRERRWFLRSRQARRGKSA